MSDKIAQNRIAHMLNKDLPFPEEGVGTTVKVAEPVLRLVVPLVEEEPVLSEWETRKQSILEKRASIRKEAMVKMAQANGFIDELIKIAEANNDERLMLIATNDFIKEAVIGAAIGSGVGKAIGWGTAKAAPKVQAISKGLETAKAGVTAAATRAGAWWKKPGAGAKLRAYWGQGAKQKARVGAGVATLGATELVGRLGARAYKAGREGIQAGREGFALQRAATQKTMAQADKVAKTTAREGKIVENMKEMGLKPEVVKEFGGNASAIKHYDSMPMGFKMGQGNFTSIESAMRAHKINQEAGKVIVSNQKQFIGHLETASEKARHLKGVEAGGGKVLPGNTVMTSKSAPAQSVDASGNVVGSNAERAAAVRASRKAKGNAAKEEAQLAANHKRMVDAEAKRQAASGGASSRRPASEVLAADAKAVTPPTPPTAPAAPAAPAAEVKAVTPPTPPAAPAKPAAEVKAVEDVATKKTTGEALNAQEKAIEKNVVNETSTAAKEIENAAPPATPLTEKATSWWAGLGQGEQRMLLAGAAGGAVVGAAVA